MGFFDNIIQNTSNANNVSSSSSSVKVEIGAVPSNIDEFKSKINFKDSYNVVAYTIFP